MPSCDFGKLKRGLFGTTALVRPRSRCVPLLLAAGLALVILGGTGRAADLRWDGSDAPGGDDWFDPGNWSSSALPTSSDNVIVDNGATARIDQPGPSANGVLIGESGTGGLTITGGGTLTSVYSSVAYLPGSQGAVTVDGAGSTWTNTYYLSVADAGFGALTVVNGGTVRSGSGYIGYGSGSQGVVTISGAGSSWTNDSVLEVGLYGEAALTISGGATVGNGYAYIGTYADNPASVTVDGAGSTWTNPNFLFVGDLGTGGVLTISNGGRVSTGDTYIGGFGDANGAATVTGAGSTWTSSGEFDIGEGGIGTVTVADAGAIVSAGPLYVGNAGTGTLTVTGGGTVGGGGDIFIGNAATGAGTVTVSHGGAMTGGGDLYVGSLGTGAMSVSDRGTVGSTNGYVGHLSGAQGAVTVRGADSVWTVGDTLTIGGAGAGSLTVSDGGMVSVGGGDGTVNLAMLAGSSGTLNIGAAAAMPAAAPGTLDAAAVAFGDGNGEIVFNHTLDDYVFAPLIFGVGTVRHVNGITIMTGDSAYYETAVDGGVLVVNGQLDGPVVLASAARLGGSGTLAALSAAGTVAPGNSIGTLTVIGDTTFAPGSVFEIETDPESTAADRLAVTGTAFLNGGTVAHIGPDGPYDPFRIYTILTADGGVRGTFEGVTSTLAFLDPVLSYRANAVLLELVRNDVTFAAAAVTGNQRAAAAAIDGRSEDADEVYDVIVRLDEGRALEAFDALSGEIHATGLGIVFGQSGFLRDRLLDHLRATRGRSTGTDPTAAPADAGLLYGPGAAGAGDGETGRAMWLTAYGARGTWEDDGNAATAEVDGWGLIGGIDMPVSDGLRFGVAGGYRQDRARVDARASSVDIDTAALAAYAAWEQTAFALRGGAAVATHRLDGSRTLTVPGLAGIATADYDGWSGQAFGEVGYEIATGTTRLEPFAGLSYIRTETDGFTETGAGAVALSGEDGKLSGLYTTLGLRISGAPSRNDGAALTPHATVAWHHAVSGITPARDLAFDGTPSFTVYGADQPRDTLHIDAGLDLAVTDRITATATYQGYLSDGARSHAGRLDLRIRF